MNEIKISQLKDDLKKVLKNKIPCDTFVITRECEKDNHSLCNYDTGLECEEHREKIYCKCYCHSKQGA